MCVCARSVIWSCLTLCSPLQSARLLCPWDSLGKDTGVGCHLLLQGIFWIQGWNPCLLSLQNRKADSSPLRHLWGKGEIPERKSSLVNRGIPVQG